jgi:hypothetical protein
VHVSRVRDMAKKHTRRQMRSGGKEGRGQQRGAMRQDCRSISVLARSPFALNPPTSCAPSATSNALLTRASIKTQTSLSKRNPKPWHRFVAHVADVADVADVAVAHLASRTQ